MFAARNSQQAGRLLKSVVHSRTADVKWANRRMGDWRLATGEWRMANGEWRMAFCSNSSNLRFWRIFASSFSSFLPFLRSFVCSFVRSFLSRKRGSSSHPIRDSNQDFITHSAAAAESESERDSQTDTVFCSGRSDSSHHNPTSFQSFTNHFITFTTVVGVRKHRSEWLAQVCRRLIALQQITV